MQRTLKDLSSISDINKEIIVHTILDAIANGFNQEISIDFITECSISKLICIIRNQLKDVKTYDDWLLEKDELISKITAIKL